MKILSFALLGLAFTVAACDSNDPAGRAESTPVSLSIAATSVASKGTSHVSMTRVRILLRTIQFHRRDDDNSLGSDSVAFRTDPIVAELSLDGSPNEFDIEDVASGTYHKISFRIHKPDQGETLPDPDFRTSDSGNDRFSVIVEGTYDGQPFVYKSRKAFQQQVDLPEDLVIDGTELEPINVTLQVDLSGWFLDNRGQPISPLSPAESDRSMIDNAIRDSFRAFRDRNADGRPD